MTELPADRVSRSRARRWLLAAAGVACVATGAVGIVVPGLPTTIFLLLASWCFARSCPWLEERLLRHRIFRPFLRHLEPGAIMPRRARVTSTALMWAAILTSSLLISRFWIVAVLIAVGGLGTWSIWRFGRGGAARSLVEHGSGMPVRVTRG